MLEKKDDIKVDYSMKEERERYYLLNPKDLANVALKSYLYEQFGISEDNYIVVLDNCNLNAPLAFQLLHEMQDFLENVTFVNEHGFRHGLSQLLAGLAIEPEHGGTVLPPGPGQVKLVVKKCCECLLDNLLRVFNLSVK